MTLVCIWRDRSYGIERLTALADMRISREVSKGERATISDLALKLLPLPLFSHASLTPVTGVTADRYDHMPAAVAYTGHVMDALILITHMQRSLASLIDWSGKALRPSPKALGVWLERLVARYFAERADGDKAEVTFIVFGWSGDLPWYVRITYKHGALSKTEGTFDDNTFLVAGEDSKFVGLDVSKLRQAIQRHQRKSRPQRDQDDSQFLRDLARSQHDLALRKVSENAVLAKILSEANTSVGGTLQKLELDPSGGVSSSRMSGGYALEETVSLSSDGLLVPCDMTQEMGL